MPVPAISPANKEISKNEVDQRQDEARHAHLEKGEHGDSRQQEHAGVKGDLQQTRRAQADDLSSQ